MDEKIIKLKFPISYKDKENIIKIDEIKVGLLKNKHLRALPDDFFQSGGDNIRPKDIPALVCAITGLPASVADDIDFEDLIAIMGEIKEYLLPFQTANGAL